MRMPLSRLNLQSNVDSSRPQAVDFDPHSLRKVLPSAVKVVAENLEAGKKCALLPFRHLVAAHLLVPRLASHRLPCSGQLLLGRSAACQISGTVHASRFDTALPNAQGLCALHSGAGQGACGELLHS